MRKLFIFLALLSYNPGFAQSSLRGNAKEIIITPPLEWKYTLGGYGARMSQPAEAIHDNIKAKALVLNDGSKKFATITMDILGFPPNVKPMIAERIKSSGWTEENMLLLPSHAHTSLEMFAINNKNIFDMPAIGVFQPQLLDFVVQQLSNLIIETEKELKEIKVGSGQIVLENLNRNRRGDDAVDKELTVTRIDNLQGDPLVVLVNWTAHPTIMDEHDMWVSGGWPGYLQRELEGWIGNDVIAMYYNGAEGDQSVIAKSAGSHYEKAEQYGRTIAKHAFRVYDKITLSDESRFEFTHQQIDLPAPEAHPAFMQTGGEEYQLDEEKIQALLNQIFPSHTYSTTLLLGELMIVGAPGEMIAEIGLDIKKQLKKSGIRYPVIGGLANEWISYLLTEDEYHQGGYETSVSFYGPTLGEVVQKGMLNTAAKLVK
jgi:hypothetical protein